MAKEQTDKKSSTTVTVASKLPHPLIMRIFTMVEGSEPVMGGGSRVVKQSQELPERVIIAGCSHPQNAGPKCVITGGYALTPGVSKDFWDKWLSQNKESMMVKNNIIFAQATSDSATSQSEEQSGIRSGLERIDPKMAKRIGVEPDKDHMNKEILEKVTG